jgi:hypothetical protein
MIVSPKINKIRKGGELELTRSGKGLNQHPRTSPPAPLSRHMVVPMAKGPLCGERGEYSAHFPIAIGIISTSKTSAHPPIAIGIISTSH